MSTRPWQENEDEEEDEGPKMVWRWGLPGAVFVSLMLLVYGALPRGRGLGCTCLSQRLCRWQPRALVHKSSVSSELL